MMVKRFFVGTVGVSSLLLFGFLGFGGNNVATVEGDPITQVEFQARLKSYPPQYAQALVQRENKLKVLDQMVDEKILMVAAKKAGITKSKEYKDQVQAAQNQLLLTLYVRDTIEKGVVVSDADLKRYYDANPVQFQEMEQRRARHILLKTEVEAKEVLASLKKGANFSALAKQKSMDPSAASGGDLGWFSKGQLVPEFEREVFALKKGQMSGIIKTQFGYHIAVLDEVTVRPRLSFDKVKDNIKNALLAEKRRVLTQNLLNKLKKEYKIKKDVSKV